ncbi:MAG: hypothetical protein EpisKO_06100 [Epibacterium sp.]
MSPAELTALTAYEAHDRAHPGAVAWLEGMDAPGMRRALETLTSTGHLERGLFGLTRITKKGRSVIFYHRRHVGEKRTTPN